LIILEPYIKSTHEKKKNKKIKMRALFGKSMPNKAPVSIKILVEKTLEEGKGKLQ
jgi:hypothetical protein